MGFCGRFCRWKDAAFRFDEHILKWGGGRVYEQPVDLVGVRVLRRCHGELAVKPRKPQLLLNELTRQNLASMTIPE